ncbi:hypothetical protein NQ318_020099 [Aromia moschata]|uniref:Uncharacterized protein n=1 Tax=Aromia moschata TaxID=1265417 RepID=A0AAV8ZAJ9_9CUCU|nr:hypothetical protein NQ318_020099 [Aromia moschata]
MNDLQNNIASVCRTCLVGNSNMKSLFSIEEIMEQKIMLCDVLMSCASVLIMEGDGLPENVCTDCFQQANTAYLFRKLCERSDTALRECTSFTNLTSDENNKYKATIDELSIEKSLDKENYIKNEDNIEVSINGSKLDNLEDKQVDENYSEDEQEAGSVQNQNDLKEINKISNRKTYSCKKCNEPCSGLSSLRKHMTEVHGELFKCEQCGKQFNAKNFLVRHITSSHANATGPRKPRNKTGIIKKRNLPRTCDICNKTFRFHSNLERHKLTHTGRSPTSATCAARASPKWPTSKYTLLYTRGIFVTYVTLCFHPGEKPYKCRTCDRGFAAPGTLMTHVRTHTGERPHVCKICGKDFPQSGYLAAHVRTHTGEKPAECKVCNRRFNQSGRLVVHMRIHSGEKPYRCDECGRGFAVRGTLKKHMRTHTGERPYQCGACGQAFAQSGTLATHMKTHKTRTELS